jgi:transglutaminase-like putative cysteine protease
LRTVIVNRSTRLADSDHPLVTATAQRLVEGETSTRRRIERLFHYVRDDIAFGFPDAGDLVTASQTIALGMGQCNTKTTLFLALCKALGIPARVHFSLIRKEIQRGLFSELAYRLMPPLISHSWLEVQVDGTWRRLDSYINDEPFYEGGKRELRRCGWDTGFSIACASGESSAAFNIDTEKFVQMDAVVDDHGVWDEPADYYASARYRNRPGFFKLLLYRLLVGSINRRVRAIRGIARDWLIGAAEDRPQPQA